ncbi:unnamed protein product [Discosporangium mesarthrocarpum]
MVAVLVAERGLSFPFVVSGCLKYCPNHKVKLFANIFKELLEKCGPGEVQKLIESQEFKLPQLFKEKEDGMRFLHDNGLWALFPLLAAEGKVKAVLKSREVERPALLPWLKEHFEGIRTLEIFVDGLVPVLLEHDMGEPRDPLKPPSAHTIQELEWLCRGGEESQLPCLYGVMAMNKAFDEGAVIVANTFEQLLKTKLVSKEVFQEFYNSPVMKDLPTQKRKDIEVFFRECIL